MENVAFAPITSKITNNYALQIPGLEGVYLRGTTLKKSHFHWQPQPPQIPQERSKGVNQRPQRGRPPTRGTSTGT